MNPLQILGAIKNPQAFVQNIMNNPKLSNNPMAKNVFDMIKNNDLEGVEQFGRNIAKERGVDFDEAFNNFKSQFPMG